MSFSGRYRPDMPDLIAPTVSRHAAWLEAHHEWGPGRHEDGFGLRPTDQVESPSGFAAWVARLQAQAQAGPRTAGTGRPVACTYRWIVAGERVLGAIALRHELDNFLFRVGGHIGYGIRPSERRRGLATWALGEMLLEARRLGLDRVLVTCEPANVASIRTIEHHGGVLDDIRDTELGPVRRHWIPTPAIPNQGAPPDRAPSPS